MMMWSPGQNCRSHIEEKNMNELERLGEVFMNLVHAFKDAIEAKCGSFRESIERLAEILKKEQLSNRHSRQGHNLRYWQHRRIRGLKWRQGQ